jgi:hypothetical protein
MVMKKINMLPWVDRAACGYSDRMRVTNFTNPGNTMFSNMIYNAVLGAPVYFIMQPNDRVEKNDWEPVDDGQAAARAEQAKQQAAQAAALQARAKKTQDDNKSDVNAQDDNEPDVKTASDTTDSTDSATDDSTSTDSTLGRFAQKQAASASQIEYQQVIVSANDPVMVDAITDPDKIPDISQVKDISYDGSCYDGDGKIIPGLYCLQLIRPPVNQQAMLVAARALDFDLRLGHSLGNIMVPRPVVTGTSPDVEIKVAGDKDPNDFTNFSYDRVQAGGQVVVPQTKYMEQWDTDKLTTLLTLTAYEMIGETKNSPVDFPELATLGEQTQSLVSNREPFVSRAALIRAQVNGVFATAGVPELSWDSLFPYTPQDIASIGDALGKGATPQVLRRYNLS